MQHEKLESSAKKLELLMMIKSLFDKVFSERYKFIKEIGFKNEGTHTQVDREVALERLKYVSEISMEIIRINSEFQSLLDLGNESESILTKTYKKLYLESTHDIFVEMSLIMDALFKGDVFKDALNDLN